MNVIFFIVLIVAIPLVIRAIIRAEGSAPPGRDPHRRRAEAAERRRSAEIEGQRRMEQSAERYIAHRSRPRFLIEYADINGELTEREVTVERTSKSYVKGFCHLRGEERTFRGDRIIRAINCETNRPVQDIHRYLSR